MKVQLTAFCGELKSKIFDRWDENPKIHVPMDRSIYYASPSEIEQHYPGSMSQVLIGEFEFQGYQTVGDQEKIAIYHLIGLK